MSADLAAGFADPVLEGQRMFRAVMDAMARPGRIVRLDCALQPPAPLTPELAAIALTLADHDTPLWLDASLAGEAKVLNYLRFHTGAPLVSEPGEAAFALVRDPAGAPSLDRFGHGTPEYPDQSTTVVYAVTRLSDDGGFWLQGPGIEGVGRLAVAALPAGMEAQLQANHRLFPRGVDCIFAGDGQVAAIPRSTRVSAET